MRSNDNVERMLAVHPVAEHLHGWSTIWQSDIFPQSIGICPPSIVRKHSPFELPDPKFGLQP
jgi:hypothetical protein